VKKLPPFAYALQGRTPPRTTKVYICICVYGRRRTEGKVSQVRSRRLLTKRTTPLPRGPFRRKPRALSIYIYMCPTLSPPLCPRVSLSRGRAPRRPLITPFPARTRRWWMTLLNDYHFVSPRAHEVCLPALWRVARTRRARKSRPARRRTMPGQVATAVQGGPGERASSGTTLATVGGKRISVVDDRVPPADRWRSNGHADRVPTATTLSEVLTRKRKFLLGNGREFPRSANFFSYPKRTLKAPTRAGSKTRRMCEGTRRVTFPGPPSTWVLRRSAAVKRVRFYFGRFGIARFPCPPCAPRVSIKRVGVQASWLPDVAGADRRRWDGARRNE